jgi:site-specific recombinase XerD
VDEITVLPATTPLPYQSAELSPVIDMVLDSLTSPRTRRDYARALRDFLAWYVQEQRQGLNRITVQAHIRALREAGTPASSINQRLAAIRKLAMEAADNGLLDESTAQAIRRVPNQPNRGKKLGNWLTAEQARAMMDAPDCTTLAGKRDAAILAVALGAGLRREEIAGLVVKQIQARDNRWLIVDIAGKHHRVRSVAIHDVIKARIDEWLSEAGIASGPIFRRVYRSGKIGESMSAQTVWLVVQKYNPLELTLAPHDMRRTFAILAYEAGASLKSIQNALGHESVETTEHYIGERADIHIAPSDMLPIF